MLQVTTKILTALTICFIQCLYIVLREAAVRSFNIIIECIARVWWLMDCYIEDTVERGVTWYTILPDESDAEIAKYVTMEYIESVKTVWCCFFEAFGVYAAATWNVLGLQEIEDDEEVGDYAFVTNDYVDEELMCTQLE
jgi:hypothetical protein